MKRRIYISFRARTNLANVRQGLAELGCADSMAAEGDFLSGLFGHMFDADDPRLAPLRELISLEQLSASERVEHVYTDAELAAFPFLDLRVNRKEIGPFGPSHGTQFDMSKACPKCGTGAIQTSPFYAPAKSFPTTGLICASSTEKFLAAPVVDAFQRAELTGVELRQARSHREHEPLPWWQIISKFEMPKMSPATRGIIRGDPPPCPLCRQDGHYHTVKEPEEIVFDKREVDESALPDIVHTWERFAKSYLKTTDLPRSRFAEPSILIKPNVFRILRRLKVRHAIFFPVRIE